MSGASIGSASLRFTGAFEREAEGRGVWLADDHVAHLVMSGDMHGPQAHTDWNLLLVEDEDDDERDIYFVQLTVFEVGDDEITERSYTLSDGDDLDFVAGAYVLDNQLRGEDGTVHIKGRAEVPRWPTAPDVDRVTTEMTAAFSDIRPFAYVAHGSVEPMVKDTALLSVVRPRDEGHDVAESLRDRLPDHWTAWVGEDEPGPDEVEDDNSPPTFAVGKNGLPVPFDKHPVQVVCSPAGLEQILAYSRFNPPGVG
ncbi:MAG: hypothetical protein KJO07_15325, partial [Deltaproteobacteria bacterium]|nr:hypothetical protein [Deltaproteobacteria bacterium]